MNPKPKYTFARFAYMGLSGILIGAGIQNMQHHATFGIVLIAVAASMIIYRLYHPNMLLRRGKR